MQTNGGVCRKHSIGHSHEERIAKALSQLPQRVAYGRLREAEAISRCSETSKIPDPKEDFLWIGYSTNDDFMKAEPEALKNFTRAWLEAIDYVKSYPEVFEAYGKKYHLEPKAVALLRERVLADYTTTRNEERIATLRRFGQMVNEVMGDGYLDTVPAAAFSTRFDPHN